MSRAGWMLGFSLAGVAGVLIAPTLTVTFSVPTMTLLVVSAFAAAVVGRLRSLPWTFVGALALGLVTTYFGGYAPQHLPSGVGTDLTVALPMIFLFIALVALPSVRLEPVGRLVAERLPRLPRGRETLAWGLAFVAVVVVFSFFFNGTFLAPGVSADGPVAAQTLVYGIVGLSLVLLVGYAGQVSLSQFAFMGIGAFCMGKVASGGSLLGVVVAVAVCAAVGALVALPVIRLRGLYLALATFAFAEAVQFGFFSDTRVLGTTGISVGRFSAAGISFTGDRAELVMLGVVFAACALVVLAIRRRPFGRRLVAVDDSPAACATVGLNPAVTKVVVFSIAAGMAGLGGALWGSLQGTVGVSTFTIFYGVLFLLFLVIWGIRTVSGAFLASFTYALLQNLPHVNTIDGMLLGGAGVILIGRLSNGILGIERLHVRPRLPWARRSHVPEVALAGPVAAPGEPVGPRRAP
jgi:branched-chain amino acid transport system permease protein